MFVQDGSENELFISELNSFHQLIIELKNIQSVGQVFTLSRQIFQIRFLCKKEIQRNRISRHRLGIVRDRILPDSRRH